MTQRLILASNNAGKLKEFNELLSTIGFSVHAQGEYDVPESDEPFHTFVENALQKARHASRLTGLPALADDSGVCVNALGGAPGVYSARYAGEHGNDQKNNALLLKNLQAVPAQQRTARFVSSVCCVFPDGRQLTVRGACEGTIAFEPRGGGGFGYDPLFLVGGKTFGELTAQEKDRVSHRGNALRKLAQELPAYLETGKDHL